MANDSSILAWKIPWPEEADGLHTVHGVAELDTSDHADDLITSEHTARTCPQRALVSPSGNPWKCS